MKTPAPTANEQERLAALKRFGILDSAPEPIFDDLTSLASFICGTPIALISLIDENRQWFKSKVGLDASETPRDISFCGHSIHQTEIFEVPNALDDQRFNDNPLVTGAPNIRFYAGMPLTTSQGLNLGTLCVIDNIPRQLSKEQREALKKLGRQVISQIENRQALLRISQLNQDLAETGALIKGITDAVPAIISYWGTDMRCRFANNQYWEWYGKPPNTLVGTHLVDLLGKKTFDQRSTYLNTALLGKKQTFEGTILKANGVRSEILINYIPNFNHHGKVIGIFVHITDVTLIKKAESDLKLASSVYQSTSEGIIVTSADKLVQSINPAFSKITGYSAEEIIGQSSKILRCDRYDSSFYTTMMEDFYAHGEWQGDFWIRHKSGKHVSVFLSLNAIKTAPGEPARIVGLMTENTQSLQIKLALTQLTDILQRTGEMAKVGGWELDWASKTIQWTDQVFAIHELENHTPPLLEHAIEYYTVEARPTLIAAIEKCVADGTPWDLELPFTTAKGRDIWVRTQGAMHSKQGEAIRLIGAFQDITERKQQEQKRLLDEAAHRNALVREVHHRIKNNLQGVTGMLRNFGNTNTHFSEIINNVITQIQSIAIIHGLQGNNKDGGIEFAKLIDMIAGNHSSLWQKNIKITQAPTWKNCLILESESVPIALVLNELIANAVKHGKPYTSINVELSQSNTDESLEVFIINIGCLYPHQKSLSNSISGTGLQLIDSLLPRKGADFSLQQEENKVVARLKFSKQVIIYQNHAETLEYD